MTRLGVNVAGLVCCFVSAPVDDLLPAFFQFFRQVLVRVLCDDGLFKLCQYRNEILILHRYVTAEVRFRIYTSPEGFRGLLSIHEFDLAARKSLGCDFRLFVNSMYWRIYTFLPSWVISIMEYSDTCIYMSLTKKLVHSY